MPRRGALAAAVALLAGVVPAAAAAPTSPVRFSAAVIAPTVRPATVWLSADGTLVVQRTRWTSWGGAVAVGEGVAEYHGCRPYCGIAPHHFAAVTVRLSDPVVCRRAGPHVPAGRYYDTVSLVVRRTGRPLDGRYLRTDQWAPCRQLDR